MRVPQVCLFTALVLLCPGCHFFWYGERNLVDDSLGYLGEKATCKHARQMARVAWNAVAESATPENPYSSNYAKGFKEGFADYLVSGGSGEPPLVPPPRYWTTRYESPTGVQAIEDWYAGWRHGAAVARATGYREQRILIPLSGPVTRPDETYYRRPTAPANEPAKTDPLEPPLPTPRRLPPPEESPKEPRGTPLPPVGPGPQPVPPFEKERPTVRPHSTDQ
jgi:hypothetical protein